ncbi:hypothetical protein SAMN05443429_10579 [Cruoricaptor ignavus]|uniref:Uncharacterized protein n=1 Tax=Cruoricaptor ignavus TaxID=1118202 RepID=A0A1M6EE62_9FLAO|nr:hypothetical protein [Cruoricaptor ignavus]QOR74299.1 hypothetical protein IMZ16_02340 [Cruoricaptor ignavus]SHI83765.1 hypothetical protein SAMN05443429_10579 [Cruoricaptor ignavus]
MAKEDFSALIGKAKEAQTKSPAQKVVPLKEKKEEILFSLHIPAENMKKLKIMAAEQGRTLKDLINSAIEEAYF